MSYSANDYEYLNTSLQEAKQLIESQYQEIAELRARCERVERERDEACAAYHHTFDENICLGNRLYAEQQAHAATKESLRVEIDLFNKFTIEAAGVKERLAEAEKLVCFFACTIKCGDPWSETCETEMRSVLDARPASPTSEQKEGE